MNNKNRIYGQKKNMNVILLFAFLYVGTFLISSIIFPEVQAASATNTSTYSVSVSNQDPTLTGGTIRCCWRVAAGTYTCAADGGILTPAQSGINYSVMCNFTIADPNGWQDFADGYVNATFHKNTVGDTSTLNNDVYYANGSCRNITGSFGVPDANSVSYACDFPIVYYWANYGTWIFAVNISDNSTGPAMGKGSALFTLSSYASIIQSATIGFGAMALGANGSSAAANDSVFVPASSANLGNCPINLSVAGTSGATTMACQIGTIPATNIKYNNTISPMRGVCGTLSGTDNWGCGSEIVYPCTGACAASSSNNTYWGIAIPTSGVSGSCSMSLTFTATGL